MNTGKYWIGAFLVPIALNCGAAENQAPLKGGICQAVPGGVSCHHLGMVKTVKEIYERGFRVVASGTNTGWFLIIEEQKK